ncbi:hypothetical protein HAX54_033676 [Datura stramonium]|uniref:Uncharacterized protein n=1 Tax=Datura stramonium TaxID=4076 RepID=A0ABS8VEA4_DATST|nr:hypothetical protein [Datura stramonium]
MAAPIGGGVTARSSPSCFLCRTPRRCVPPAKSIFDGNFIQWISISENTTPLLRGFLESRSAGKFGIQAFGLTNASLFIKKLIEIGRK